MNDTKPTPEQIKELHKLIETGRITRDMMQKLLSTPGVVPDKPILTETKRTDTKKRTRWLIMLEALTSLLNLHPGTISPHFTEENFPLGGASLVDYEVEVVELDRAFCTTQQVLAEMNRLGLGRPEVDDLMRFGAKQAPSYVDGQFVALIPLPWNPAPQAQCIPCLVKTPNFSGVSVLDMGNAWDRNSRFLARKPRLSR